MEKTLEHIDSESRQMLSEAKQAILSVEPDAEVFLFGSQARGDANDDSDWDLLALLPGEVDWKRKSVLFDTIFHIELQYRTCFNLIINSRDSWLQDELLHVTPFYINVEQDRELV